MTQSNGAMPAEFGASHGASYGADRGAEWGRGPAAAPYSPASPGENGASGRGAACARGRMAPVYGAARGAAQGGDGTARRHRIDAETVIHRLEEAGMTLMALPHAGPSTRLRSGGLDFVREAAESYGWTAGRIRPPVPSAARITRMDEALAWIPLIPRDRVVLRRIVGARALVSPITERHLFSWRRIATMVGADHKAVQRWHAQGIDQIVAALR